MPTELITSDAYIYACLCSPAVITMFNLPREENLNKWHWTGVRLVVIIHHMQTSADSAFSGHGLTNSNICSFEIQQNQRHLSPATMTVLLS
jgi:isochorismate hydrolase